MWQRHHISQNRLAAGCSKSQITLVVTGMDIVVCLIKACQDVLEKHCHSFVREPAIVHSWCKDLVVFMLLMKNVRHCLFTVVYRLDF